MEEHVLRVCKENQCSCRKAKVICNVTWNIISVSNAIQINARKNQHRYNAIGNLLHVRVQGWSGFL